MACDGPSQEAAFRSSTCELGGGMIVAWSKSSAARLSATCFAVVAAPLPRPSAEKFVGDPAVPLCRCGMARTLACASIRRASLPLLVERGVKQSSVRPSVPDED